MRNVVVIITMMLFLFSCATIREAKDRKAVGRVLSNPALTEKVYQIGVGLHPIAPQIPVYIKGKDSVIYKPYPVDVIRDSIIREKCPTLNLDSMKKAMIRYVEMVRVDTLKEKDTSLLRLYDNAVWASHFKDGQITELRVQNGELRKQSNKKTWWIVGIGIGALLVISGLLVIIFKR